MNPLLITDGLPLFDRIRPEHVVPAITELLNDANVALESVTRPEFVSDWNAIAAVLDVSTERLGRAWGAVNHLNGVADTPALRKAYNDCLPQVTEFWTRLGADDRLYEKYKAIDSGNLNSVQKQAHKNALRDFVLGGAELSGQARERFAAIQERLAELSQKFSENTLDATDGFSAFVKFEELAGVPADILQSTREAAQSENREDHKLTLKLPCYLPVMQFADSAALRASLYRAYTTRASEQAQADLRQYDNTALMHEILALRQEEARLLGYRNFGELSLASKMAPSPETVIEFLRDLAGRARPFALKDLADLRAFATDELALTDPQSWDLTYVGEKLKQARFSFSEQEVKQYFTLPKVLAGLFKIVETLFDVRIKTDMAPVWHAGVSFYRVERITGEIGAGDDRKPAELIGQFYLDTVARDGKRGGAWMDDVRARWLRPDNHQLQTPVAHLVCNFAEGVMHDGKRQSALLTHDDVITLFHEFGHGLHHMLTQVDERHVSGINGVEWDAVELPSQFMENFCWEWDVMRHMTSHVQTGDALPRALFDKMLAARNYQSGMQTLRQIEFALFDMLLHTGDEPAEEPMALLERVRKEVAVIQPPDWSRTAHTFGHVFAGGYAAGYYSYKWAEVLSADAYAAFEENATESGLPDVQTGRKYRQAILEVGGSRPAMESFKAFRGREPSLDALLRHQGMVQANVAAGKD